MYIDIEHADGRDGRNLPQHTERWSLPSACPRGLRQVPATVQERGLR